MDKEEFEQLINAKDYRKIQERKNRSDSITLLLVWVAIFLVALSMGLIKF